MSQGSANETVGSSASSARPDAHGVRFITLTRRVRLALPPLFFSSIPKRAIGFSFPSGVEGAAIGGCLVAFTVITGFLLSGPLGVFGYLIMAWVSGGTGLLILYNSTRGGRLAFIKSYCSVCRLRPIIEEHETMHLMGEPSEEVIWGEAKKRYSYDGLSLGSDPKICSFCPIAKRLRTN
jgi:hypothetical protein